MTTAYNPRSDGQTENNNKTMQQVLRAFVDPRTSDWCQYLAAVEFAINDSRHASTLQTPFMMIYGENPYSQLDFYMESALQEPSRHEGGKRFADRWRRALQEARHNIQKAQVRQAQDFDKTHAAVTYKVGQKVLLDVRQLKLPANRGAKHKLRKPFSGPFGILEVYLADDGKPASYRLRLPALSNHHCVFAPGKLAPYHTSDRFATRKKPEPPATFMVEGLDEHVVEPIRDHREIRQRKGSRTLIVREYLVRWKEYGESDDQWLTEKDLNRGCPLKPLLEYQAAHARELEPVVLGNSKSPEGQPERLKQRQRFGRTPLRRGKADLRMLSTIGRGDLNISGEGFGGMSGRGGKGGLSGRRGLELEAKVEGLALDFSRKDMMRGTMSEDIRMKIAEYEDELRITSTLKEGKLVDLTASDRVLKVLVLFSGTGTVEASISRRFPKAHVITLDLDPKWQAIHCCDILDWVSEREGKGGTMLDY
jgi:hypothetical protein